MKKFVSNWGYIICAGILGGLFFCYMYGEIISPTYVAWLLREGGDPSQHYIGWLFFRDAPWSFPLGYISQYGYPVGITVTYTDSLPLFAFFFKLFRQWLPEHFQYFGIWLFVSTILQTAFGARLLYRVTGNKILSAIGSLFFVLNQVVLLRWGGHQALAGHWLILWAIWLIICHHSRLSWWSWSVLLSLTLVIHPFLFILCGFCMLADIMQLLWVKRSETYKRAFLFFALQVCIVVMIAWIVGIFFAGHDDNAGYGIFSMNVNAIINPWGWSTILQDRPIAQYQYEGLNYLGFGVLLLLLLSMYEMIRTKWYIPYLKKWWPLVLTCTVLTVLALSHIVQVDSHVLLRIPYPEFIIETLFAPIRASGRLFWVVYYLLIAGSFFIFKHIKKSWGIALVLLALGVQYYDMHEMLMYINKTYEDKTYTSPLTSSLWSEISETYNHIAFVPAQPIVYEPIALYAWQTGMTLNTGYFSRPLKNTAPIQRQIQEVREGNVNTSTVYIVTTDVDTYTHQLDTDIHVIEHIDGYTVILPYFNIISEQK